MVCNVSMHRCRDVSTAVAVVPMVHVLPQLLVHPVHNAAIVLHRHKSFARCTTVRSRSANHAHLRYVHATVLLPPDFGLQVSEQESEDPSVLIFREEFLDALVDLAGDRVPNVRLALAKVLSNSLWNNSSLKTNPKVIQIREKLMADKTKDVVYFASHEIPTRPAEGA